jgi:hypothetical protein
MLTCIFDLQLRVFAILQCCPNSLLIGLLFWRLLQFTAHNAYLILHHFKVLLQKPLRERVRTTSGTESPDAGSIVPDTSLYGPPSDQGADAGSGLGVPAASGPQERSIMHSISAYMMRQSYIGMLIIMMVSLLFTSSALAFVVI